MISFAVAYRNHHNPVFSELLEDWSSKDVKVWSAEQNRIARNYLDALPGRAAIARRVEEVNVGNKL